MTSLLRALALTAGTVLSALAAFPPGALVAQEAHAILERASARHEALQGFCADFRQEIEVTLLRQTTRSRGELCQVRSDRFDMRFADPAGDRIVADGTHLWVYYPSTDDGQAFRTRIAGADGHFDLHREFLSDPGERYEASLEGRGEVDGRESYILNLTPRVPSPYRNARVWIDTSEYLIRKLVILEDSESIRTVELSSIRLNPSLSEDHFRFDPPPGVQVITR
jgi:outer membrane lipoprotein-sorting protein